MKSHSLLGTSSGPLGHLLQRRRVTVSRARKIMPFSFGEGARRADEVPLL